jgi:hypothetical protein
MSITALFDSPDSLENYSAAGVSEDTELTQATTSQNQHSNVSNVTASVQGSNGFVTSSAFAAFGAQEAKSQSAADSSKHAVAVITTRNAASREHAVS